MLYIVDNSADSIGADNIRAIIDNNAGGTDASGVDADSARLDPR